MIMQTLFLSPIKERKPCIMVYTLTLSSFILKRKHAFIACLFTTNKGCIFYVDLFMPMT